MGILILSTASELILCRPGFIPSLSLCQAKTQSGGEKKQEGVDEEGAPVTKKAKKIPPAKKPAEKKKKADAEAGENEEEEAPAITKAKKKIPATKKPSGKKPAEAKEDNQPKLADVQWCPSCGGAKVPTPIGLYLLLK